MEFDKSRVYTALNADEVKIGSKCIFANNLDSLKCNVEEGTDIRPIVQILNDSYERRFKTDVRGEYPFAYLVSEPEEKSWIVYLYRDKNHEPYLTSCRSDKWEVAQEKYGAKTKLFEGTEEECEEWYASRRNFTDVIAAWEDGKSIQYNSGYGWEDCCDNKPLWDIRSEYRIKPESLKWTDLKIGDTIRYNNITTMVTAIDNSPSTISHIYGYDWISDGELVSYEKVE